MRNFLKSLNMSIWSGAALMAGGTVSWNIGSYLDNGNIERIVAAGRPLYMNTPPETAMMFGGMALIYGMLFLVAGLGDRVGAPMMDSLGVFLANDQN